jgi:hypothetical protein
MSQHLEYRYSITIKTDDDPVLHCLRALSQYAQISGNKRIPWGGTKKEDWERDGHRATFHFSQPTYRQIFIEQVSRILPKNLWEQVAESDHDPAAPQS